MVNFYKPKKASAVTTVPIELEITGFDLNGAGVGRYRNKPVFVEGALPNEHVVAKLFEQKSKYARAQLIKVVKSSELRVTPICQHFEQCGGCDLQHISHQEQIQFKQQKVVELFSRNAKVTDLPWQQPIVGEALGYRRKARIGVQYNKLNQPMLGFRKKSSNHITPITKCSVLEQSLAQLFKPLSELITQFTVLKAVSHIEVIAQLNPVLVFRLIKSLKKADIEKIQQFEQTFNLTCLLQTNKAITDSHHQAVNPMSYTLHVNERDYEIKFNQDDFIQVNSDINQKMVQCALDWLALSPNDNVLDLFSGLGNFTLPIASLVNTVTGIEGVQEMVSKAQDNAKQNQLDNVQFYQGDLNSDWQKHTWFNDLQNSNKVILDPARAGALQAVKQLSSLAINKVVYVSCDPATLARDTAELISQGFTITKIALMDMFAQTKHIETIVCFEKK